MELTVKNEQLMLNNEKRKREDDVKVHFKKGLSGYSGTADDAVYYYHPKLKMCLVREYVIPNNAKNTDRTKAIMANLKLIQPSDGYKTNFNDYLLAYNDHKDYRDKPMLSWYNLYIKMLFAMQKSLPEQVDLKTLTREQIHAQELPCISVKKTVEAGLLPPMRNYDMLDKQI